MSTTRTRLLTVLRTPERLVLRELLPTFLTTLTTLTLLLTDLEDPLRRLPLRATLTSTTNLPTSTREITNLRAVLRSTTALHRLLSTTLPLVLSRLDPLHLLRTEEDLTLEGTLREDTLPTDLTDRTEVTTRTEARTEARTEEMEEMEEMEDTETEDLTAEISTTLRWVNTVLLPDLRGTINPQPLTTVDRKLTLPPLLEEEMEAMEETEEMDRTLRELRATLDPQLLEVPLLPKPFVVLKSMSSVMSVLRTSELALQVASATSP